MSRSLNYEYPHIYYPQVIIPVDNSIDINSYFWYYKIYMWIKNKYKNFAVYSQPVDRLWISLCF